MIRHYLNSGFQNPWKYKTYTFINTFGLALGLSSCLLISNYVVNEISFDNFYKNKNCIYRLLTEDISNGSLLEATSYIAGPQMADHFSQVKNYVRFYNFFGP